MKNSAISSAPKVKKAGANSKYEYLNNMIWAKCPKNVFVTKQVWQLGGNSAVIEFNEGANGVIRVLEKLGIDIGKETVGGTAKKKKTRIKKMHLKTWTVPKREGNNYEKSKKAF